jgi:hypothetical protein
MTAEALFIVTHPSRRIACAMLPGMRSMFLAPVFAPHGEEPRPLRGVSNHEALDARKSAEAKSCLSP